MKQWANVCWQETVGEFLRVSEHFSLHVSLGFIQIKVCGKAGSRLDLGHQAP